MLYEYIRIHPISHAIEKLVGNWYVNGIYVRVPVLWIRISIREDPKLFAGSGTRDLRPGSGTRDLRSGSENRDYRSGFGHLNKKSLKISNMLVFIILYVQSYGTGIKNKSSLKIVPAVFPKLF
jgi:hypothetical protein